jgi:hypothetical protein
VAIGAFLPRGSTVLAPDALLGLAMILLAGVVTAAWQVVRGRRPDRA